MDSIERSGITRLRLVAIMDWSTIPSIGMHETALDAFYQLSLNCFQFSKMAAYPHHYKDYRIGRIPVDHLVVKRNELIVDKSSVF